MQGLEDLEKLWSLNESGIISGRKWSDVILRSRCHRHVIDGIDIDSQVDPYVPERINNYEHMVTYNQQFYQRNYKSKLETFLMMMRSVKGINLSFLISMKHLISAEHRLQYHVFASSRERGSKDEAKWASRCDNFWWMLYIAHQWRSLCHTGNW